MTAPAAGPASTERTEDAIFGGRLRLVQPRTGHRFGLDAIVLAAHAAPLAAGRDVLDAGAGCGVVALALLHLARERPPRSVVALELQETLARCAGLNARRLDAPASSAVAARCLVVRGDLRAPPLRSRSFGLVVANPPYRRPGTGRLAPDGGRALARHELTLDAAGFFVATEGLLASSGHACVVHLAEREAEVVRAAAEAGLSARRIRRVRPRAGHPPHLVLLDFVRGSEQRTRVAPDLVVHDDAGEVQGELGRTLREGVALPDAW